VDVSALVLADGDRVRAWGRLVRGDRGDWFEPPRPRTLLLIRDPPVAPAQPGAVPVAGADFARLADRRERGGLTEGYATLTGTWSAGQLLVDRQDRRPPRAAADDVDFADWTSPPCPAPEGGWPRSPGAQRAENLDFDIGDLRETGAAVAVTVFRPSRTQLVLVVAAADADAVEAWLRPQLGARLCVVPSRWTRRELQDVRDHLSRRWDEWNLLAAGEINDSQGQPRVTARPARMLPEIAAWAAPLPEGLLLLRPWLVPMAPG
jgi:hypothetical protein